MKEFVKRENGEPFIAKDGAAIFELFRPEISSIKNMSIATGYLKPGQKALAHWHKKSEEVYYIVSGIGRIKVGETLEEIKSGDAVCIPVRSVHALENTSKLKLMHILAISSPPYSDEDMFFV